jgi:hypothetical protein
MRIYGKLISVCILICISVSCYSQSYFVPSYAGFEMLDNNPDWIVNNKVKAINIRAYLVSGRKPERNVTTRLLFDDSGRIIRRFTNRGKDDSEELSDKKFALNERYRYQEESNFYRQYMLSIRSYDEKGRLPQPDTLVEVLVKTYNPLKLSREIYSQDTIYYSYDDVGNLVKKHNANDTDELNMRYKDQRQLVEIIRSLRIRNIGGNSRHVFKYNNQQVQSVMIEQFSGPKVLVKYYYDKNGYLLKSEAYVDKKLMAYYEYKYESS